MKKWILAFSCFISTLMIGMAQEDTSKIYTKTFSGEGQVIKALSNDGKIYIVITVIAIILIGLFLYLFRLEKKITRLENRQ